MRFLPAQAGGRIEYSKRNCQTMPFQWWEGKWL